MSAEKYVLLEERIRQTASLVGQLREENPELMQENERLRQHIAALEEEARRGGQPGARDGARSRPVARATRHVASGGAANADGRRGGYKRTGVGNPRRAHVAEEEEPHDREDAPRDEEPQTAEEYFQLGKTYERRGQFEPAVQIYQQLLEADNNNLDVAQRLAFLLEKLNRDEEAAPLWDRIWRMRAGRSRRQRWSR